MSRLATTRVYVTGADGVKRLVATPGDVVPTDAPSYVTTNRIDPPEAALEPFEGYDAMSEDQVVALLPTLDPSTLEDVQAYERTHLARGSIHTYKQTATVVRSAEHADEPLEVPAASITEGYNALTVRELRAEFDKRGMSSPPRASKAEMVELLQKLDAKADEA